MLKEWVDAFMEAKDGLRRDYAEHPPESYDDIVMRTVRAVGEKMGGFTVPDCDEITVVNDGEWQGTLVYIIPEEGYQPREYWYVRVGYGSCSWCDAFLGIEQGGGTSDEKVDDYMAMSLHVVQGVHRMEGDVV